MTPLLPDEVAFIQSKLSPQSAQLRHKYPNAIWNAADCWDDAPLPTNYYDHVRRSKAPKRYSLCINRGEREIAAIGFPY